MTVSDLEGQFDRLRSFLYTRLWTRTGEFCWSLRALADGN